MVFFCITSCKKENNNAISNATDENSSGTAVNFDANDSIFLIDIDSLTIDANININSFDQPFNPQFDNQEQSITVSFNSSSKPIIAIGFNFNNNKNISFIPIEPVYQSDSLELQYTLSNICNNLSDCSNFSRKLYALSADSSISTPHETNMTVICNKSSDDLCEFTYL